MNFLKSEAYKFTTENSRMDKKVVIENWPYFLSEPFDFDTHLSKKVIVCYYIPQEKDEVGL